MLRECPGFRLLFVARSVSLLGDWFSLIAVIALLREVVGSSPKALSGLLILKLLPIFLAGPMAGVVADRFSRKTIMVVSDLIRAVLVLGLTAAPFVSRPLEFTYALILLQVVSSAFFEPARSAALPQLVPERHLSAANAIGAVNWSIMFTLGAALGGLVTETLGWRAALAIDALTYLVSAVVVSKIVLPRRARRKTGRLDWQTLTGVRDFRDGMRFIFRRPDVATVLSIKTGWGIAGAITLFLTLFGERVYTLGGRPDLGVGVLYVARALGTGIGPLLARRFLPDETPKTMRRLIAVSFLWPLVWYLAFSWAGHPAPAVLFVIIAHFGGAILWVYSTVLLQRIVPEEYLGRVMSTDLGLATLAISASTWLYGILADAPDSDLRSLIRWMAMTLLIPTAFWLFSARRWPVGVRNSS